MDLQKNKTFCMAPWVHTYLGPDNTRNLCCAGNADFGDKNALEDVWNGDKMKQIRLDLLAGNEIKECERCPLNAEHSYRRYWNDKFEHLIDNVIEKTDSDGTFHGNPIAVDYRTNVCNFKCKTCNESYSSAIFNEKIKLGLIDDDNIKTLKNKFANNKSLIKKELDYLISTGDVVDMYWAGGEPIYFKEHWESLQKLIDIGKSENVTLRYSSNLSSLTWKDKHLTDYISKFKHTEIMCSMDATGDLGGWIRTGFEYDIFLKNFESLVNFRNEYPDKLQIILYSVLTVPTLVDLPNINRMANKYKVDLFIQEVIGSNKLLGMRNYPKYIISEIFDSIKKEIINDGGKNVPLIISTLDELLKQEFNDNITEDDINELLFIEKNRKEKLTFENIIDYNKNLKNFYLSKIKSKNYLTMNLSKDQFDGKPFCILPFIHLATHPIGTVTPCCITDMENDMSTAKKDGLNLFLNKDSLEDITNSENFKSVRKKMLNGEFPSECKNCYYYEQNKIYSKRMESNLKFRHLIDGAIDNTDEDGRLKKLNYKYIELRLGTVCNLKCVTCNPFSSNRWNEDVAVFKDTEFEKSYFKCDIRTEWFRDLNFYDQLLKNCDELEEVWINGGEPTLIKEHAYFLEKLIENGKSKKINLHYSINMTDIPDRFIKIWKEFKNVRIHLSIDDLESRNDYIRYGSKWNIIYDNFKKIIKYKDIFRLEVCQTISILNVMNIDNFKKFTLDNDIIVAHNYVHHPSFQHVSLLPNKLKNKLVNNLKYLREDEKNRLFAELNKNVDSNGFEKFINFISLLDTKRNVKIFDFLPEFTEYFTNDIIQDIQPNNKPQLF